MRGLAIRHTGLDSRGRKWAALFWALTAVALSSTFAITVVREQFGGYDLSPVIDMTWRYIQGQRPGAEYINTLPPAFLALVKTASFLPLQWLMLTWINVLYTLLITCLLWLRGPSYWNNTFLPWVAPLLISLPLIYTNHIWYSAQAGLAACLFVFSIYASFAEAEKSATKAPLGGTGHLALSTALVIGVKPNLGLPIFILGLIMVIAVWRTARSRSMLLALGMGSIVGLFIVLLYSNMSLAALLETYSTNSGRAFPSLDQLISVAISPTTLLLIPVAVLGIAILLLIPWGLSKTPKVVFLVLSLAISCIPIITDWDSKVNNISLPLLVLTLLVSQFDGDDAKGLSAYSKENDRAKKLLAVAISASLLIATWGGLNRDRMKGVGPFWEDQACCEIKTGYFDGLRTGPWFKDLHADLRSVGDRFEDKRIFFGPRLEFAYSLLGFKSPEGLPLFWFAGTSYNPQDESRILQAFRDNSFEVLVFSKDDYTRFPEPLLKELELNFGQARISNTLTIWVAGDSLRVQE